MANEVLPTFFLCGCVKAGTTSLYHYLRQHPDVFMPEEKEPIYFVPDTEVKSHYYETWDRYCGLFDTVVNEKAIGEASGLYLYYSESARMIKDAIPDAKIIISLRDPVQIAYSLYRHMCRVGAEKLTFEDALKEETQRLQSVSFRRDAPVHHASFYYTSRAMLYRQVKCYLDTFDRGNVLILLFDELREDPLGVCRKLYSFLGVEESFEPDLAVHNAAWAPRAPWINRLILSGANRFGALRRIRVLGIAGNAILRWVMAANSKPSTQMSISDETRARLIRVFRSDISQLEMSLGIDLSRWYESH